MGLKFVILSDKVSSDSTSIELYCGMGKIRSLVSSFCVFIIFIYFIIYFNLIHYHILMY